MRPMDQSMVQPFLVPTHQHTHTIAVLVEVVVTAAAAQQWHTFDVFKYKILRGEVMK